MSFLSRAASALFFASLALIPAVISTPSSAQAPVAGQSGNSGGPLGFSLDAAQRARADTRQAQFQKDVAALRQDTTLTDAQKQVKYTTLYQAMDKDMLAILTSSQRTQVLKQREINTQLQKDVRVLQADKTMTNAQKQARYLQLVQNARNASLALMPPAQRAVAEKRFAEAEKAQQAQQEKIAQARKLSLQLQKSETPTQSEKLRTIALTTGTTIQSVIADKTLSDQTKTEKIVALRKDALSRDLALLSPTQRSLYERIQALINPAPAR